MVIQGGANLVRHPPVFANDGKRLLVCTASSVTVFSVATALPVLQLNGHTDSVTSVSVIPVAKPGDPTVNRAWTSSLDGTVRLWDFEFGNVIRTLTYGRPIESMVIPSLVKRVVKSGSKKHENIAFISVRWDKEIQEGEGTGRVILFNLTTGKPLRGFLAKTLLPQRLVVSPYGSFVGTTEKRKIWVWSVPDGAIDRAKSVKSTLLHHTKICSVVAFDPLETVVAGGDETGRILFWHNVGERSFFANPMKDKSVIKDIAGGVRGQDDAEACTTLHWHAKEVKSLVFSDDGTYLFSGGSEGTLVIWQPETGKQQFLPRLGGNLLYIIRSSDPFLVAISCSNNSIKFVNFGTMIVEKACQGITPVVPLPKALKVVNSTRAAFLSKGAKLVLPTDNLSLQFYDTARDHELLEVQIARSTTGVGSNNKKMGWSGPMTFVTHITFSTDGSVLATVDVRLPEENVGGGSCLKFWDHQVRKPEYVLNTLVDEPHGAEITALVYHPSEHMVVTCSLDATFRVWVRGGVGEIQNENVTVTSWRCRSVGSYRHKEALAASFSPDGSLLAVCFEDLVTLWNPQTNGFVNCLAYVPSSQRMTLLGFVHNTTCLVAASSGDRPHLVVWQLSTLSVLWSCNIQVEALSVDPNSSHFGIIALGPSRKQKHGHGDPLKRKASVAIFNPENPTPIAVWSLQEGAGGTLFFGSSNLIKAKDTKLKSDTSESCMVVLTGSHEYVLLNPYIDEDEEETILPIMDTMGETVPSAYSAMYGHAAKSITKERRKDVVGIRAPRPWGDLFDAPSHVLPSLTRISLAFMESLLEKHSDLDKQLVPVRESESLPR